MTTFDALSADKLRAGLDSAIIGRDIVVVDETTSTNDSILERTSAATPEGFVVLAERRLGAVVDHPQEGDVPTSVRLGNWLNGPRAPSPIRFRKNSGFKRR